MHFAIFSFIILDIEETVVRQLSFPSPDSSGKLVPERTEIKRRIFMFPPNTRIWGSIPLSDKRRLGVIQNEKGITAIRSIGRYTNKPVKERGLLVWEALDLVKLYLHGKHWELPEHHTFLAYASNAMKTRDSLTVKK